MANCGIAIFSPRDCHRTRQLLWGTGFIPVEGAYCIELASLLFRKKYGSLIHDCQSCPGLGSALVRFFEQLGH